MHRSVVRMVMRLLAVVIFGLCGCGSGGDGSTAGSTKTTDSLITHVGWYLDNSATDYVNNGATCLLSVYVYYDAALAVADIDSLSITAPNGWHWTITAQTIRTGTSSSGNAYVGAGIYYGENPQLMPLAGAWKFALKLKSGEVANFQRTLHDPNSTGDATYQFVYSREDWSPSVNQSHYTALLSRFPTHGYSLHYSAADGGKITSSGLPAIRASFLAGDPRLYNSTCWLYDANNVYLGNSNPEYSSQDHSRTNLITAEGELAIIPAATNSATGPVDLSRVKFVRFVFYDGAQYEPNLHAAYDYRSISGLIAVN